MKRIVIILISLYPWINASSQEVDDFLDQIDFEPIDQLTQMKKERESKKFKPPVYKAPRQIWLPPVFQAMIKPGTIIINQKTNEQILIEKSIYVYARELVVGSQTSLIKDKNGEFSYRTKTTNLVSVEADTKLHPQVNPNIIYKGRTNYHSTNKEFPIDLTFKFQSYSLTTNYLPTLFRGSENKASGKELAISSYHLSELPLQFGLSAIYDFGYWEDSVIGTSTWKSFYLGPESRVKFLVSDQAEHYLKLGVYKSIFHRMEKAPETHSFSTIKFGSSIERVQKTDYGTWNFGLHYGLYKSSIKTTTEYLDNSQPRGSSVSLGASIGYVWDYDL